MTEPNNEQLWRDAEQAVQMLALLLSPEQRRRDGWVETPYWFMVGRAVGRVERLTRALAERYAVVDGASYVP